MKKIFFLIFISTFFIQFSFSQSSLPPPLPSGWERIHIKNLGSIDLPPTMEVQNGKYKEINDEIRKTNKFDSDATLIAQQKGLNEYEKAGFEKYARVIVETAFGSIGDFEKLNFDISEYTQADVSELNTIYKQQLQQSFYGTNLKLIEWYPLKLEKINGMSCFHISYKRQLQDKPFVLVHIYGFQNNDRMHNLTLSYRLSEANYWKENFATILKSFRITNIR